jgi:AcrR family transcriptional regulator
MPRPRDAAVRDRILTAALPLFYERGIQNVGMAELVEAAGCGKSALYREFPGKDALVLGYLERIAEQRAADEERVLARVGDTPRAAVVALVQDLATRSARADFRGCPFRNYLREFAYPDAGIARYTGRWLHESRTRLRTLVSETGVADPDAVADQVWLVMDGLWSSAPYRDRRRLGAVAVSLIETLLAV